MSFAYGRTPVLERRGSPRRPRGVRRARRSQRLRQVDAREAAAWARSTPISGTVRLFGASPSGGSRPVAAGLRAAATGPGIRGAGDRAGDRGDGPSRAARVVAPHARGGSRRGAARAGIGGPGGRSPNARERTLGWAAAARVHRARVRERPAAAGPGRADRGRRRGVPAPFPRLARAPDARSRRRRPARLARALGGGERPGPGRGAEGDRRVRRTAVRAGRRGREPRRPPRGPAALAGGARADAVAGVRPAVSVRARLHAARAGRRPRRGRSSRR